jgi:hypothetical protein
MVHVMSNLTLLLIIGGLAHRYDTIRNADVYVQPAFGWSVIGWIAAFIWSLYTPVLKQRNDIRQPNALV